MPHLLTLRSTSLLVGVPMGLQEVKLLSDSRSGLGLRGSSPLLHETLLMLLLVLERRLALLLVLRRSSILLEGRLRRTVPLIRVRSARRGSGPAWTRTALLLLLGLRERRERRLVNDRRCRSRGRDKQSGLPGSDGKRCPAAPGSLSPPRRMLCPCPACAGRDLLA